MLFLLSESVMKMHTEDGTGIEMAGSMIVKKFQHEC